MCTSVKSWRKCMGCYWGSLSSNWRLPSAMRVYFSIFGRPTRKSIFLQPWVSWSHQQSKEFCSGAWVFFFKPEQFESLPCGKGEPHMEYKRMSCQERNGQLCKFCEKDETTSAPLPTRRPYPDYGKLPNFHDLWSATPTNGREPDDFQPRAQIKRLLEESELVSGDSEAIRKFSDKYIFPEKLVSEYVEHLS